MSALEPTGSSVIAAVCNSFAERGRPVPRHHLATIGRHAKTLLEDGFDLELVITAAEIALRRGSPQFLCFIAHDLSEAQAGTRITRREYEKALQDEREVGGWKSGTPRSSRGW